MNKLFYVILLLFGLLSCGNGGSSANATPIADDCVEIIYFHGKQRCPTCMDIERATKEVVNSTFAKELGDKTIVFKVVDITSPEGESLADEYQVSWSSLFVSQWRDGKEKRCNLTDFGFRHARNNPEKFKQGLTDTIRKYQK